MSARIARCLGRVSLAPALAGLALSASAPGQGRLDASVATAIDVGPSSRAAVQAASAQGEASLFVATFDAAWRIVRDTHFDPAFDGVDWDAVRRELRPRAEAARDVETLRKVIGEMLGRLGASHFVLLPGGAAPGTSGTDGSAGPWLDVRWTGDALLVVEVQPDGPAARAGVRPGWLLRRIDGEPVEAFASPLAATLPPRLARVEIWRAVADRLAGPPGSRVELVFEDEDGTSRAVALERRRLPGEPAKIGSLPAIALRTERRWLTTDGGRRVGYLRFNAWMPAVDRFVTTAVAEFREADALVLDLRGNTGGLAAMLMGVAGHFLDSRISLGTMRTREGVLQFVANPRRAAADGSRVEPYGGPLAILVDALTGSASECFAGGMQAIGRARIFGERSMGQALPALFDRLPNGDVLIHAYGDFTTPKGTRLEGEGVVPDEVVPSGRAELIAGRDAVLEAALRWVDRCGGTRRHANCE